MKRYSLPVLLFLHGILFGAFSDSVLTSEKSEDIPPVDVYVVPITEGIGQPNLYILRRALKEAIENGVEMVLLDMDTPGGQVHHTTEMMEMLARFKGITATYVNTDAISAGSFIAAATQEIYFAPDGLMGASAVIQGGGQDLPETARMKVESYLRANIRTVTQNYPYRSDVIRAMLDSKFELKIGDDVIKPAGELLTLTAREATAEYGNPPHPLLSQGIYDSVDELLEARFGPGNYVIKHFEITYSEHIAKWMSRFAPALLGIGLLMLFLEFKTPGFGLFGIAGIGLIGIFFISQYIAGLSGNEAIIFFALGLVLLAVEVFFFLGTMIFGISGLILILGSLFWAMFDNWPDEPVQLFSLKLLAEPLFNLSCGLVIMVLGIWLSSRLFSGSSIEQRLLLHSISGKNRQQIPAENPNHSPVAGTIGVAVTDLFPSGRVEIDGIRYEAQSALGLIPQGSSVRVQKTSAFGIVVEEIQS